MGTKLCLLYGGFQLHHNGWTDKESSLEFTYKLKGSLPTSPKLCKLLKYSGFRKQGGLFWIEEGSELKTGSETLTWLTYWENSELSVTAGNAFIMERTGNWNAPYLSIVKQCPEWNDLMFHKCKNGSKRRHHPQTKSPQKQSKGKAKCAISSVMEWKDVYVNRQPVSNNSVPVAEWPRQVTQSACGTYEPVFPVLYTLKRWQHLGGV